MHRLFVSDAERFRHDIQRGVQPRMLDEEFIRKEILRFKASRRRKEMITGERYLRGVHDILARKRTVIGTDGELEEVKNLPNNRIVDNQYKKMVIQKVNYLLGQPISFRTDDDAYSDLLKAFFNKRFLRLMNSIGRDSLNGAVGWMYLMYDQEGRFRPRRFFPYEVLPFWADEEHTVLDAAVRIYEVEDLDEEKLVQKVEAYTQEGVYYFTLEDRLVPDPIPFQPYFTVIEEDGSRTPYNWSRIPLIPFKYNSEEVPLIHSVKSLQDGINVILSTFQNNMEEDCRNSILVLVNYDGTNLGEFRRNLAAFGAVKVRTEEGIAGDVRTLHVEVNADNYRAILEIFKRAIIENAMGYDAKDDRISGNPNQMNIQSMYSDIDLDANRMETEYQAAFEEVLHFFNLHLLNTGQGDFRNSAVEIIFNRDMMMSEKEIIENVRSSVGLLSDETLVANHPWVDDPEKEMQRLERQRAEPDPYTGRPPPNMTGGDDDAQ